MKPCKMNKMDVMTLGLCLATFLKVLLVEVHCLEANITCSVRYLVLSVNSWCWFKILNTVLFPFSHNIY
jgi:hypothetical protein